MKKNILSFAFLAASTLFISNLAAKEFVVSRTDDLAPRAGACTGGMATDCSLREAVLAANADNTATSTTPHVIKLNSNQTYTLTQSDAMPSGTDPTADEDVGLKGDLDLKNHIQIQIINGSAPATLQAEKNADGTPKFWGRLIEVLPANKVQISDLIIKGGISAPGGGGIHNSGDLTLIRVAVRQNSTSFKKPTAGLSDYPGGGIFNDGGTLSLINSVVELNVAVDAGGIYNNKQGTIPGTLNIQQGSIVQNNMATGQVGGVYNNQSNLLITDSTVQLNQEKGGSGGVSSDEGKVQILRSKILNNYIRDAANPDPNLIEGRNLSFHSPATVSTYEITESLIALDNPFIKKNCYGVISHGLAVLNVQNSTIAVGTNATCSGVIVGMEVDNIQLQSSTVMAEGTGSNALTITGKATSAALSRSTLTAQGKALDGLLNDPGTNPVKVSNTLFSGNCFVDNAAKVQSQGNNLYLNSSQCSTVLNQATDKSAADLKISGLSDHGGLTPTVALIEGSPAIDQGSCTSKDQRGVSVQRGVCDIGAFEALISNQVLNFSTGNTAQLPNTKVGQSSKLDIFVNNTAEIDLKIPLLAFTILDQGSIKVDLTNCSDRILKANDPTSNCKITVTFAPNQAGGFSTSLKLPHNLSADGGSNLTLNGTGFTDPIDEPFLQVNFNQINFPQIELGKSVTQTSSIILKNVGTADLANLQITLIGVNKDSFSLQGSCFNTTQLAPLAECDLKATFEPQAIGSLTAQIQIQSNAKPSPFLINLSGEGIDSTTPLGKLSVTPTQLNFSAAAGQTSAAQIVTVKNIGNADLVVKSILEGANANQFVVTGACLNITLAPQGECQLEVKLAAQTSAPVQAQLNISSNGVPKLVTVILNGNGAGSTSGSTSGTTSGSTTGTTSGTTTGTTAGTTSGSTSGTTAGTTSGTTTGTDSGTTTNPNTNANASGGCSLQANSVQSSSLLIVFGTLLAGLISLRRRVFLKNRP